LAYLEYDINYVFTLETKVKSQDEEINKLKESNGELNGSNRMMSSRNRILWSFPVPRGKYVDLLPARYDQIVIGSCDFTNNKTSTAKPVLGGHPGTKKKWPFKTGDLVKEVQFIFYFKTHP
jgi:hypothetical protein